MPRLGGGKKRHPESFRDASFFLSHACARLGFSGTLILHIPHTEVITKVEPVGIFYQGIDTLSQISLIRHIDYIDIDGMIRI